jgi:hypothetical protein
VNYVDINVVRYAAMTFAVAEKNGQGVVCEDWRDGRLCPKPVEYLIPDATRPGGGGRDIEQRPAMVCREHAEKMLGYAPNEQPIFRRLRGSGEEDG